MLARGKGVRSAVVQGPHLLALLVSVEANRQYAFWNPALQPGSTGYLTDAVHLRPSVCDRCISRLRPQYCCRRT